MKKKAIFTAVLSIVLSISLALPTQARTVINSGEIRDAQHARNDIQRIYNNGGLVFKRTRDITYHYDTNHIVTTRVEYGNDVVAEGNTLAAELGINPNSYSPNHSERGAQPWQLAGWKIGDNSASTEGVLSQIACNNHMDVYAVWKKDCSSSVNWNGGTGSGGSMSGYAYYNNGNLTKFACKLPTSASRANYTFTDFSGNRAGATVYLTDKSTFICNWKLNYKEESVINQNPNWIDGGSIQCYGDFVVPANAAVIKLEWITNSNSFSYTRGYGLTCGVTPSFTGAQVVRGNSYFKGQINGNQVYEGVWYVCTPGSVIVHNNPDCGTWNDLARLHIWYKY